MGLLLADLPPRLAAWVKAVDYASGGDGITDDSNDGGGAMHRVRNGAFFARALTLSQGVRDGGTDAVLVHAQSDSAVYYNWTRVAIPKLRASGVHIGRKTEAALLQGDPRTLTSLLEHCFSKVPIDVPEQPPPLPLPTLATQPQWQLQQQQQRKGRTKASSSLMTRASDRRTRHRNTTATAKQSPQQQLQQQRTQEQQKQRRSLRKKRTSTDSARRINFNYVSDQEVDALDARVTELLQSERALRHAELEAEARASLSSRTGERTLPELVKKRPSPQVALSQTAPPAMRDAAHDESKKKVELTIPQSQPQEPPAYALTAVIKAEPSTVAVQEAALPTQEQVAQVCADLDAALAPADDTLTDYAVAGRLVAVTSRAFAMLERLVMAAPPPPEETKASNARTQRQWQRQPRRNERRPRRKTSSKGEKKQIQKEYQLIAGLFRACVGALLLAPETLLIRATASAYDNKGTDNADLVRSHIALNMLSLLRLSGPGTHAIPVNDLAGSLCAALVSGNGVSGAAARSSPPSARCRSRWWAVLSDDLRILDACTRHVALTCGTSVMEMCDFLAELWLTEEMWCEPAATMLGRLVGRFAPAPWTDDALLALTEGREPVAAVLGASAARMGRFLLRLVNVALGRMLSEEAEDVRRDREAGAGTWGCRHRVADFLMRVGPGRSDIGRLVRAALVKLRASLADQERETALLLEAVARTIDGGGEAYVPPIPLHGVRDARVYMWDVDIVAGYGEHHEEEKEEDEEEEEEKAFRQQEEQVQTTLLERQRQQQHQQEHGEQQRFRTPLPRSPARSQQPSSTSSPSPVPSPDPAEETSPDRITRTRTRLSRFLGLQVFPSLGMGPGARLTAAKFRALCENVLSARRVPTAGECARCIACMDLQGFGTASLEELVTLCTEVLELGPASRAAFGDKSPLHRKLLRLVLEIWQRSLTLPSPKFGQ